MDYKIHKLRDHPDLIPAAAHWFQHTFGVPESAYRESMEEMMEGKDPVPQWYVAMVGDEIAAGMGVIENDFHERKDLAPNVCAVYTDEQYRGRGMARALLDTVCEDMAGFGIETLYLVTSHTSLYERYGWEFYCVGEGDGEDGPIRFYRHRMPKISLCGDDCLQCPRYLADTEEKLKAVAELWHRVGWRSEILSPEEMRCTGCSSHKVCSYGITDCVKEHGTDKCSQCGEFPCDRINQMLDKSRQGQQRCREVCTPEEYEQLERSYFHKEENLRK